MLKLPAQSPLARYGFAVFIASFVVFLRAVIDPILQHDVPILLSMVAVFLSAWFFGIGPGIAATLISFLGGLLLFLSPWDGIDSLHVGQIVRLVLFLSTGCLVSVLSESVRRTTRAWQQAEREKERLILEERNRLAREIHDTLAQGLTGIIIQLEAAEDSLADDPVAVRNHLRRAAELARVSLAEARRSVQALRPAILEERNLGETLRYYIHQITDGTGVKTHLQIEGKLPTAPVLPANAQSELLRIGLEALTNAVKHANASDIWVTLTQEADRVHLSVRDNGRGIPAGVSGTGLGLIAMQERAEKIGAAFSWSSSPGSGTEVAVTVPLTDRGAG